MMKLDKKSGKIELTFISNFYLKIVNSKLVLFLKKTYIFCVNFYFLITYGVCKKRKYCFILYVLKFFFVHLKISF